MDKKQSEAEYVGANKHRSVLEGELDDLELKRQSVLRAAEEALDDKRIEAVANIIRDAVSKIFDIFRPAVQAIFTPEKAESGG